MATTQNNPTKQFEVCTQLEITIISCWVQWWHEQHKSRS